MWNTKKKILYLEDDEFTRLMVQSQLENAGFDVESYANYTDVVSAMAEKAYDLILTDLNMDGYQPDQVVSNIKAAYAGPVVVLSASKKEIPDADLVLSKPMSAEDLQEIFNLFATDSQEVSLDKVYKFACGDHELLVNYITTFVTNYEKDLSLLKEEVSADNQTGIRNRAHKMLSSVAYYDQKSLNNLLQQLEIHAYDMTKKQLTDVLAEVEARSEKLLQSIRRQVLTQSNA